MLLLPAIDLYDKKVVRLKKGDYDQMTIYSDNPLAFAKKFAEAGSTWLHTVDLEGARDNGTPNFEVVSNLAQNSGLKVEIGGGIRSLETIEKYMSAGVERVILGTAALTDRDFLVSALDKYGEHIAVGVDINDGYVAIRGWKDISNKECFEFCRDLEALGVKTIICTDISRDGMMGGSNVELYTKLSTEFKMNFIASGGVSTIENISALKAIGLHGAIVGRTLYEGDFDLVKALEVAHGN